jgi:hypothetical protein
MNIYMKCIKIIEYLGSEALTGILVHKVNRYINKNSMNIKNNKKNGNN